MLQAERFSLETAVEELSVDLAQRHVRASSRIEGQTSRAAVRGVCRALISNATSGSLFYHGKNVRQATNVTDFHASMHYSTPWIDRVQSMIASAKGIAIPAEWSSG